jgi:hypothetical protein
MTAAMVESPVIFQSNVPARRSDATQRAAEIDRKTVVNAASGDVEALGSLVDQWAGRFFGFTDALRIHGREAEDVVEEVIRRLAFDSPRFVARPEKLASWLAQTLRDCAGAVLARRSIKATPLMTLSPVGAAFSHLISQGQVSEAIVYLNSQTLFRFTGIYRLDGMRISNLYLYDRESGFGSDTPSGPVADTYCLWVQETLCVVQMPDSLSDPRAVGHPKREVVRSYCGGPIRAEDGNLLGTICHFDYAPHTGLRDVSPVLCEVGPSLAHVMNQ